MQTLGKKIKEFRTLTNQTLKQVAQKSGCTPAYLSQVERDKTSPSIASLKRIAEALGVRIVDFFMGDEENHEPVVIGPSHWIKASLPRWKADIKQMVRSVKNRQMQPFYTVIEPGGGAPDPYSHEGEEFGFMLQGELTIRVGSKTYLVKKGQAFYYSSTLPHSWVNESEEDVKVIWVVTPPTW